MHCKEKEQPIWKSILKDRSDIFIFMEDNVYGDDKITIKLNKLSKAYTKQKQKFLKLKETNEIYAIWDDHDYGKMMVELNINIRKKLKIFS